MTQSTTYKPLPGTIAAKAIEFLQTLKAPDWSATSSVVLEAIGQPDLRGLKQFMEPAIKAGLVIAEREKGSRELHWRIGHGRPIATSSDTPDGDHADTSDLAGPPPTPDLSTASAFHLATAVQSQADASKAAEATVTVTSDTGRQWPFKQPATTDQAEVKPTSASISVGEARQAKNQAPQLGFLCALFSDGRLVIHSDGISLDLPADHAQQLRSYLNQTASHHDRHA